MHVVTTACALANLIARIPMSFKLASLATAIAMALGASTTHAAALEDIFKLRGYVTLGAAHSDLDTADFVSSFQTQPEGVGTSRDISFDIDSKFGAQLDLQITPRLSGVIQLVSESNDNNSWNSDVNKAYRPSLEWANLSYRATDNLTLRAGRIVLPLLMGAEYRKVGFANHWLRAPVEVYGGVPFTASDGGDISYRSTLGNAINTARVHYGVQSLRTEFIAQVETMGFNDTLEIGALTVRAAYMSLHFETSGTGFANLINPFVGAASSLQGGIGLGAAAQATRLRNRYDASLGQDIDYVDLGVTYDPGKWFTMAEVLRLNSSGFLGESTSGFVSGGYRWNTFTPYATFSFLDKEKSSETGISLAGLPPQLQGLGGAINNILVRGLVGNNSSQQTLSLGLRWDVASKFAIKGQYDYVDLGSGSTGLLENRQPDFVRGTNFSVVSIAVDYVF
jgi:opacity protein-like surface antigen